MKIEPRGKYPGIKLHLDEKECKRIVARLNEIITGLSVEDPWEVKWVRKVGRKIKDLEKDMPLLLKERTIEDIIKELEVERDKSVAKLAAIADGKDWRGEKG